jgi:predicted ATPase
MSAIASSAGIERCKSIDTLTRYFGTQRTLLILDSCEHVIDHAASLTHMLLSTCPRLQILATSRQVLRIDGERVYRVPPLNTPDAIQLFSERAQASDSSFELTDTVYIAVTDICRRLDGIALAIELAAARANAFSAATIAQRLDEHFLVLTGGTHAALSRHRTMGAAFDWSYDLLDQRERCFFRSLSVCVDGFTLDLAASIWTQELEEHEVVDILASLADKSLVQCDLHAERPRYRMLEPARQYARQKLLESGEYDAAVRAHARALISLAEDFESTLAKAPDRVRDACIDPEYGNFRAALHWSCGPGGSLDVAQRLAGYRAVLGFIDVSDDMRRLIRSTIDTRDEVTSPDVRSRLELAASYAATTFELNVEKKLDVCRRALRHILMDDRRSVAMAQYYLGHALRTAGDFEKSEATLRDARATASLCGAQFEYVVITQALATVRVSAGDLDDARSLLSEALRVARIGGWEHAAVSSALTLAEVEFSAGDAQRALDLSQESIRYFRDRGNLVKLAWALVNASAYLVGLQRFEEARHCAHESLRYAITIGKTLEVGWAMQHLATIAVLSNDRSKDRSAFESAAKLIGFVDGIDDPAPFPRDPNEQREYEKLLFELRNVFEEHELVKLMAVGRAWPQEQAVAQALKLCVTVFCATIGGTVETKRAITIWRKPVSRRALVSS